MLNIMICSPEKYIDTAVIAKEAGEELLTRLDWMTLQPTVMIDIGCKTGMISTKLQERYPQAQLIAMDAAENLLEHAQQHLMSNTSLICADGQKIPLKEHSVDIIFANLFFSWQMDDQALLQEWRRILKPNGVLLFTALGPNTLKEWPELLHAYLIPRLVDMHDIGDLLVQQVFSDPIVDVNHYTLNYQHSEKLIDELTITDMITRLASESEIKQLTNKRDLSVTFEVIFAHAFMDPFIGVKPTDNGLTKIPASSLRQL